MNRAAEKGRGLFQRYDKNVRKKQRGVNRLDVKNYFAETAQSDSGGDDQIPQRRLHQIPAQHPTRQHVRVQQTDAAL